MMSRRSSVVGSIALLAMMLPELSNAAAIQQNERSQESSTLSAPDRLHALQLTSAAFRQATAKIERSLVTIESFGGAGTTQGKIGGIRKQGEGNATGVVVSADGLIVTSTFSFLEVPSFFSVIPQDGARRIARMVGRDDTRKICLLKIEDVDDLPVPEMVPVDEIEVGQWAISVGVGYGDASPAISMGVISAKNRIGGRAIQTDANISPANYGGPLIDIEGRMLGICVPMDPQSQAIDAGVEWYDSGIGFAIPLASADRLLDRLKAGEHIEPAFLGVQTIANPETQGLLVEKVVPDSAADKAKLNKGDQIVALDGKPIVDLLQFKQLLSRCESGQTVELKVIKSKGNQPVNVSVKLGVMPQAKQDDDPLEPPKIR